MERAFYSPKSQQVYRILVNYQQSWRPIFWFKVGSDGSIYLGPRFKNVMTLKKGSKSITGKQVKILYEEGQEIKNPEILKNANKISFHASGIVHAAGDKLLRNQIRTMHEQEELCQILFQHPSQYASVSSVRNTDICLNYAFNEMCPLQGLIFVAPKDRCKFIQIKSIENQITLILPYNNLEGTPDLILQIILSHGFVGKWPPQTYLLFKTNTAEL
ncbi:hypothetical protein HYU95_02000 [Candidatus Daviesbacteria bacterium]|nr:hypothetical protein [Candidatus Daviesbacteria bacterium]